MLLSYLSVHQQDLERLPSSLVQTLSQTLKQAEFVNLFVKNLSINNLKINSYTFITVSDSGF